MPRHPEEQLKTPKRLRNGRHGEGICEETGLAVNRQQRARMRTDQGEHPDRELPRRNTVIATLVSKRRGSGQF